MEFKEVTPQQYKKFVLNEKLESYGVSDKLVHKEYADKECIGIRLLVGNKCCLVREDYLEYCY